MTRTVLVFLFSAAMFAQGGFRGAGRYEILSPLSAKVLDLDRNDQRTVIQFESRRTDNQVWDVTDAGGGYFYLRNGMNGFALAAQDDRNSTPLVGEQYTGSAQQQWRFEAGQDNTAIVVNRNGKAIDIPYGSKNNGIKINTYGRNGEENQRWRFQPADSLSSGNNRNNRNNRNSRNDRNNRNDRYDQNSTSAGRGGGSRYDLPQTPLPASGGRDADGVYLDERDRMYKMDGDGVCFYRERNFRGDAVCATVRNGRARWNAAFTEIGSVKFFGRATGVQLFDREEFRGNSVEITGDEQNFNRAARNTLRTPPQSMRVY